MPSFMTKFEPHTYALLRITAGLMFIFHGTQKLFEFPAERYPLPDWVTYGGGSIETIGGLMIMIGLFSGWAAFISSGMMAVGYFMLHAGKDFWPLLNGGERAALWAFIFLYIATRGSGIWSVDAMMKKS